MDEITNVLELGIKAKRNGNISDAISLYEKAKYINPFDSRVYNNLFRVQLGIGNYFDALKSLICLARLNRIDDNIIEDDKKICNSYLYIELINKFKIHTDESQNILNKVGVSNINIKKEFDKDKLLNNLIVRVENLTFYIGVAYIGLNEHLINSDHHAKELLENTKKELLGHFVGNTLRNSNYESAINNIGLILAICNFKIDKITTSRQSIITNFNNIVTNIISNNEQTNEKESINKIAQMEKEKIINVFDSRLKHFTSYIFNCNYFIEVTDLKTIKESALGLGVFMGLQEIGLSTEEYMKDHYYICLVGLETNDDKSIIINKNRTMNLNTWQVSDKLENIFECEVACIGDTLKNNTIYKIFMCGIYFG